MHKSYRQLTLHFNLNFIYISHGQYIQNIYNEGDAQLFSIWDCPLSAVSPSISKLK